MYSENDVLSFAQWFSANWEFYESTLKGEMYISKSGEVLSVDDIFYNYMN